MAKVKKSVKKRWFEVIAPEEFNNIIIGEVLAAKPEDLKGRNICLNLGSLTNDPQKQIINVHFKVVECKENSVTAELIRYELIPAQVKRLTKKAKDRADDSFICETRDKIKVRIKPLILTRNHVQNKVLMGLRKRARLFLTELIKKETYKSFSQKLVFSKMHIEFYTELRKVYPNNISQIRMMQKI